jgi:hypothetical protein
MAWLNRAISNGEYAMQSFGLSGGGHKMVGMRVLRFPAW